MMECRRDAEVLRECIFVDSTSQLLFFGTAYVVNATLPATAVSPPTNCLLRTMYILSAGYHQLCRIQTCSCQQMLWFNLLKIVLYILLSLCNCHLLCVLLLIVTLFLSVTLSVPYGTLSLGSSNRYELQ